MPDPPSSKWDGEKYDCKPGLAGWKRFMELLVKAYPPQPGGGVGAYLCGLALGEAMRAKVKGPRLVHGLVAWRPIPDFSQSL